MQVNMSKFLLVEEALREEKLEVTQNRLLQRQAPLPPLTDDDMIMHYRVNRKILQVLCEELGPLLRDTRSSRAIDPIQKILTALTFFGRGSYQQNVGQNEHIPMSQQSVSRCLREVSDALNNPAIVAKYIRFPQNREERNIIKRGFYEMYGLPGICGCIDCTHIAIIRPTDNEERFFNRKHYHSLNVQMICDDNNNILNVDARYGGATHDSFIWQNSPLVPYLESLTATGEQAILLGDSGYPLREYLMIPIEAATENSPEWRYNQVQKKARSTIERTFGILKGRWRCLLAARELHYDPHRASRITIACSVLHNMCIQEQLAPIELSAEEVIEENQRHPPPVHAVSAAVGLMAGRRVRENIIRNLINI